MFTANGSTVTYGTGPDTWDVYAFASSGQNAPTVTPGAGTLGIVAMLAAPAGGSASAGVGISIGDSRCIDESSFARGVSFTLSGDLGGCALYLDLITNEDESSASDPCRGTCAGDSASCTAPSVQVLDTGMMTFPNMSFTGGSPQLPPDTSQMIGFRWRLAIPDGAASCNANITLGDVRFLGI